MGPKSALLLLLVVLALTGAPAPAAAQMTPDLSCTGARRGSGCDEARIRRQREVYDMPPVEQLRDEGVQVRRIFYSQAVEWSEHDIGALVFERRPGRGPTVRFQSPRGADGNLPEPLVALLTPDAWREALISVETLRRNSRRRDGQEVCLFGWDYHVEIGDPARAGRRARLYRRAENACSDPSPAEAYVRTMAALAERFFPACGLLRFPVPSEAVSRLPVCAWLQGDRAAAAAVRNAVTPFLDFTDAAEAARLFDAFGDAAELDWNGTSVTGRRAVAEHWARAATQSQWPEFRLVSIRGENAARVVVRGELEQGDPVDGPARACYRRGHVEMIWTRDESGRFSIGRVSVGPFEPFVPASLPPSIRSLPSPCGASQPAPAP